MFSTLMGSRKPCCNPLVTRYTRNFTLIGGVRFNPLRSAIHFRMRNMISACFVDCIPSPIF